MAVNLIVGKPGAGKTYFLTKIALAAVLAGRDVYTNYPIDVTQNVSVLRALRKNKDLGSVYYWRTYNDFINIKSGVVLCDEAYTLFGSKDWQSLPMEVLSKFFQHRKDGVDIWACSQRQKSINANLRDIATSVYRVKKLRLPFVKFLFYVACLDADDVMADRAKPSCYGRSFFFFNKQVAFVYDTFDRTIVKDNVDEYYSFTCLFSGQLGKDVLL